jgi:hypothetical protein
MRVLKQGNQIFFITTLTTWLKNTAILIFVSSLSNNLILAQENLAGNDSTDIYENIETYSEQRKFTKYMFSLIFKPVALGLPQKKVNKKLIQKPHSSFEGKIIRQIHIETLNPLKNSLNNPNANSQNFISKAGNSIHVKTHSFTIRNLLLIHQNQIFDSLLVKESERLVRSRGYITDVSFFFVPDFENSDSVDIFIRVLDKWSIIPGGSLSASRLIINIRENNFIGLGHEFRNGIIWNHSTGDFAYNTKYYIPNIRNTYINSTLQYGSDEDGNFIKNFSVDRPFFSPFAKWAAGVSFSQQLRMDSIWTSNIMPFKFNTQDYWAGSAIPLFKGNTANNRMTNFISSARFIRIRYLEKPPDTIDTLQFYTNENFVFASIGISTRLYVQDKFIFKFGVTEDVPVGRAISFTSGYQKKNNEGRLYFGLRYSSGEYYPWGYLSSTYEYGAFLHDRKAEQGVFNVGVNYFTELIEIGKWKFRQFVKPQVTIGINRTDYDTLTFNNEFGLRGFNSPELSGNSRLLFTSQTQSYPPWNLIGFHFGPYINFSLGMLGDISDGFKSSKVYSQIGIGVLIKNDNLVLNAFQISLSFYPIIPGKGENIFKINSFQTSDFGFRDFEIGKPAQVVFR